MMLREQVQLLLLRLMLFKLRDGSAKLLLISKVIAIQVRLRLQAQP